MELAGRADATLTGGLGNDILIGGAGADSLNGGDGFDRADYSDSGVAVTIDLAADTASGGNAAGDTLDGIEHLVGSAHAHNLTGDSAKNNLWGRERDDRRRPD